MALEPEVLIEEAREIHAMSLHAERAAKIAAEIERLAFGMQAIAGVVGFHDDPTEFVATLVELADSGVIAQGTPLRGG